MSTRAVRASLEGASALSNVTGSALLLRRSRHPPLCSEQSARLFLGEHFTLAMPLNLSCALLNTHKPPSLPILL